MSGKNQHERIFEHFGIVLDNSEGVYFAGQEIVGKVVIECREPRRISEVLLEVKGRARTHWTKSRKTCSANETYFCEQFNTEYTRKLCQTEEENSGGKRKTEQRRNSSKTMDRFLHVGTHKIPFSYALPKNLPSSFEGQFGFIRYTCRAICESPWDFDTVCLLPFTVIGIEDLNQEAELLSLPLETHCSQSVDAFCVHLGSVSVQLRLAKGGLTPGEKVPVDAKVRNGSRRKLSGLELRLSEDVVYKSKTFAGAEQKRSTKRVVQRVRAKTVPRGGEFEGSELLLAVPSVPPRLAPKCRLIDLSYSIELSCLSPPFCVSLPVVIGTIPLLPANLRTNGTIGNTSGNGKGEEGVTEEQKGQQQDTLDSVTERSCAARKRVRMPSSILSELYPSMSSPCYRELFSGPVNVADERERKFHFGPKQFTPKYPFYSEITF